MNVEVLGPGCPKCNTLVENVRQALKELALGADVVKVTDIKTMIEKGVMMTPGLILDGRIVSQGKVLTVSQIKEQIQKGVAS